VEGANIRSRRSVFTHILDDEERETVLFLTLSTYMYAGHKRCALVPVWFPGINSRYH